MPNHSSIFDHLVLLAYLPVSFRYVGKEEIFSLPFFGWVCTHASRSRPREGILTLEKTAEIINDGVSIVIYPEGTRSKDGQIHKFKRGGFLLAVKTGHRIIPVSISGAQRIMPPGSIKVVLGQPISTNGEGRAEQAELMEEVHKVIEANYDPEYGARE